MQVSSANPKAKSNGSRIENFNSDSIKRNALVFGIAMIALQVGLSIIYGFLITIPPIQLNVGSIVFTIGIAILVIGGFGLVFGYTKRLIWSGIGFTFFITAFCIEVYPLINDFWTKVGLQSHAPIDFSYSNKMFNLYLSDRQTGLSSSNTFYGNSITNALKCALSISIAFSSILGRAGQLQCLIVSAFGVIGFELNRQLIQQNQGTDTFGTFYIFTFGGFMGLGLGLLSLYRERKTLNQVARASLKKYTGSEYSVLYAFFGCLIIFALFPLLSYQFDSYSRYNSFSPYTNAACVIAAMGAGAISATSISYLINGYLISRDAIHGPIAGAIAVGASSLYVTNPVYAFVAGAGAGIIQTIIQNLFEKRAARGKLVLSTVSWSLFGLQGIIGAGFASGWKAIYFTNTNGLTIEPQTLNFTSQFEFYGGLISAGIGAAFGLVVGIFVILVNGQRSEEYFEDSFYWFANDGIRFENAPVERQPVKHIPIPLRTEQPEPKPYTPIYVPEPEPQKSEQVLYENLSADVDQFDFSESNDNMPNPYAYL